MLHQKNLQGSAFVKTYPGGIVPDRLVEHGADCNSIGAYIVGCTQLYKPGRIWTKLSLLESGLCVVILVNNPDRKGGGLAFCLIKFWLNDLIFVEI